MSDSQVFELNQQAVSVFDGCLPKSKTHNNLHTAMTPGKIYLTPHESELIDSNITDEEGI